MKRLTAFTLLLSAPVAGQVVPTSDSLDRHVQTLALASDQVGRIAVYPLTGLTLTVRDDERIDTVVLGDPNAFAVSVDDAGRALSIRVLHAGARSTLSVMTTKRPYYFELAADDGPTGASQLRLLPTAKPRVQEIAEPEDALPADAVQSVTLTTYKLSGSRALQPMRVTDDGKRTSVEWAEDQALPAVFGVGPTGAEEVTDGNMRDGLYVLDRVWPSLVFRMDDERARATRVVLKPRR